MGSKSMGRERPVHKKASEHEYREDGWCPCGRWSVKSKARRGEGTNRKKGNVNLDVIEGNSQNRWPY